MPIKYYYFWKQDPECNEFTGVKYEVNHFLDVLVLFTPIILYYF